MRVLHLALSAALLGTALAPQSASAWGKRAHAVIDRAALAALPADGPVFLQKYADYVAADAVMPDSWRSPSEPFSKLEEDPNHGWFKEQFAFLKRIPRSRWEFVLALHDEYLRIERRDPERAKRMNVRHTGLLPYAVMESYGRMVVCMRWVRSARAANKDAGFPEMNCAYEAARLGHYLGDGAQPLHDSIHSDGWRGPNPKGYTTDRSVHSRFESKLVDAMVLEPKDLASRIAAPDPLAGDLFQTVLAYLDRAAAKMELVYQLEKRSGFADAQEPEPRALVYERTAVAAAMLRDMLDRAWAESAQQPGMAGVALDPADPANPNYNAETGSAPA